MLWQENIPKPGKRGKGGLMPDQGDRVGVDADAPIRPRNLADGAAGKTRYQCAENPLRPRGEPRSGGHGVPPRILRADIKALANSTGLSLFGSAMGPAAFTRLPWMAGRSVESCARSAGMTGSARQRTRPHQVFIHRACTLPAFANRPHHERLPAPHVAGSEHLVR